MTFFRAQAPEPARFAVHFTACQAGSDRGFLNEKSFLDTYRSAAPPLVGGMIGEGGTYQKPTISTTVGPAV